jgi:mRNA-degrading endonuclease RelE of RelBE toxin-antitoxin system
LCQDQQKRGKMDFRIADSFTDSLARLAGDEQKVVKTTAFDLQLNPANPGMKFHKLDRAKDARFWSVRASRDLRLIVHRTERSLLLCYVGHHDDAYRWAERRKLERHPKTGAMQLVEVRERVEEIPVPRYVVADEPKASPLLADFDEESLLSWGVPPEWIDDVRQADEEQLMALVDHLPQEAAEALIELATGGTPAPAAVVPESTDPYEHPDTQRRFRLVADSDELARALEFPWERWTVFLHPAQREWVEKDYSGPARVSGSAGTGKTVVAIHRAAHLARSHPDARVLLATFSGPLAEHLRTKLGRLIGNQPRLAERIEVYSLNELGRRLYERNLGGARIAETSTVRDLIEEALQGARGGRSNISFLLSEWEQVVDAWNLRSWEEYRDVSRIGRKTRLPEARRAELWEMFSEFRRRLAQADLLTWNQLFHRLAVHYEEKSRPPFDFAVIDEAQDISVAQLKFLAEVAPEQPNALFFAADLGQRIFQHPFSWKSLGIDIRGRSRTLKINYRTSHQIRSQADRLLDPAIADVDGEVQERRGTISAFNGPDPLIRQFDNEQAEIEGVSQWLANLERLGIDSQEVGVFVRSTAEMARATSAIEKSGLPFRLLDESQTPAQKAVSLGTMHQAKGLEFRAVAVMACDDEVIPNQARIEQIGDEAALKDVYDTERHLLYVACTRAREQLWISGVAPVTEFIDDLAGGD